MQQGLIRPWVLQKRIKIVGPDGTRDGTNENIAAQNMIFIRLKY